MTANPNATTSFTSPSSAAVEMPWSFQSRYLSSSSRSDSGRDNRAGSRAAGRGSASGRSGTAMPVIAQAIERFADEPSVGCSSNSTAAVRGVVRADQAIAIAPALEHRRGFGAQDGVDAAELPADFPGDFKQHRRLVRRLRRRRGGGCGVSGVLGLNADAIALIDELGGVEAACGVAEDGAHRRRLRNRFGWCLLPGTRCGSARQINNDGRERRFRTVSRAVHRGVATLVKFLPALRHRRIMTITGRFRQRADIS